MTHFKINLITTIETLNKKTPIVLDENTSIFGVDVDDGIVTYKARLAGFDYNAININQMPKSQRITNLVFVCLNEDVKYIIKNDFDIKYDD